MRELTGTRRRSRKTLQTESRRDGFGLLELLIAMTILAIGMLGIMKLQMQSGFGNAASRETSAAVTLARSKMEAL